MYNVGDEVVYPMHGAGRIVAIEEREVMEEKQSYYILEMPGEVKVMIPTATAEEHGIRSVINKEEAQKVMSVLEQDETDKVVSLNSATFQIKATRDIYDRATSCISHSSFVIEKVKSTAVS